MGLEFLRSVLVPYLYRGLNFAILQSLRKRDNLIDKLQICVIGMANISVLFFQNLLESFVCVVYF